MINLFENIYDNEDDKPDGVSILLNGLEIFYRKSSKGFIHLCLEEDSPDTVVFNWQDMKGKFTIASFNSMTEKEDIQYIVSHFTAMSRLQEIVDNKYLFI